MRYLLLVSHGTLAPALHGVLKMLVGPREDVISVSLEDGMDTQTYAANVEKAIAPVGDGDVVFCFGDIIGGSPLTNALNVLAERDLLARTTAFGGMNLPMVLTAVLESKLDDASLEAKVLAEGQAAVKRLDLSAGDDEEDV